ncbi:amino acid ABC transporter permease [Thalassobaculum sp.]|uniref:amino acid ABC transporter permease n=1 Tax=Thalassobaculum sp. TaxID=2022740 RepID=UPI0032ED6FF6
MSRGTDLPVLLPAADRLAERVRREREVGAPIPQLRARHGVWLAGILVFAAGVAEAQTGAAAESILTILLKWTPLLFQGFIFNLAISFLAMAGGTVVGALLGIWQISLLPPVRAGSWLITQFFRNAPWLVLLFFCMFLLPFQIKVFGLVIPLPDWVKATFGLALPVMANVSELVRGAIQSIPSGQWESAESLAFNRRQTLWMIILPQCVKRMLPPWMNLYAILTMATVLASVVGVSEVMTLTGRVLSAEGGRTDLLVPFYSYILLWFFLYCYPIARLTVRLERRFAVKS